MSKSPFDPLQVKSVSLDNPQKHNQDSIETLYMEASNQRLQGTLVGYVAALMVGDIHHSRYSLLDDGSLPLTHLDPNNICISMLNASEGFISYDSQSALDTGDATTSFSAHEVLLSSTGYSIAHLSEELNVMPNTHVVNLEHTISTNEYEASPEHLSPRGSEQLNDSPDVVSDNNFMDTGESELDVHIIAQDNTAIQIDLNISDDQGGEPLPIISPETTIGDTGTSEDNIQAEGSCDVIMDSGLPGLDVHIIAPDITVIHSDVNLSEDHSGDPLPIVSPETAAQETNVSVSEQTNHSGESPGTDNYEIVQDSPGEDNGISAESNCESQHGDDIVNLSPADTSPVFTGSDLVIFSNETDLPNNAPGGHHQLNVDIHALDAVQNAGHEDAIAFHEESHSNFIIQNDSPGNGGGNQGNDNSAANSNHSYIDTGHGNSGHVQIDAIMPVHGHDNHHG